MWRSQRGPLRLSKAVPPLPETGGAHLLLNPDLAAHFFVLSRDSELTVLHPTPSPASSAAQGDLSPPSSPPTGGDVSQTELGRGGGGGGRHFFQEAKATCSTTYTSIHSFGQTY